MNTMEKLEMARQLARLQVDVIEAGFPISSDEDFEATREVAKQVGALENAPTICGLTRRRSEEHTSELQSRLHLVCRLLLEKKKKHKEHGRGTTMNARNAATSDGRC